MIQLNKDVIEGRTTDVVLQEVLEIPPAQCWCPVIEKMYNLETS